MISNLNRCYFKPLCSFSVFYLKVENRGDVSVRCILQYSICGKTETKKSQILENKQKEKLFFPPGATNIYFNILNYSIPTIPLIYHGCIPYPQNACYEIHGTALKPTCIKIDC